MRHGVSRRWSASVSTNIGAYARARERCGALSATFTNGDSAPLANRRRTHDRGGLSVEKTTLDNSTSVRVLCGNLPAPWRSPLMVRHFTTPQDRRGAMKSGKRNLGTALGCNRSNTRIPYSRRPESLAANPLVKREMASSAACGQRHHQSLADGSERGARCAKSPISASAPF